MYRLRRDEFWVALATGIVVVVVGVEQGIILALLLSLVLHVRRHYETVDVVIGRNADGHLTSLPPMPGTITLPGLIVYRFGGGVFYANATQAVRRGARTRQRRAAPTLARDRLRRDRRPRLHRRQDPRGARRPTARHARSRSRSARSATRCVSSSTRSASRRRSVPITSTTPRRTRSPGSTPPVRTPAPADGARLTLAGAGQICEALCGLSDQLIALAECKPHEVRSCGGVVVEDARRDRNDPAAPGSSLQKALASVPTSALTK